MAEIQPDAAPASKPGRILCRRRRKCFYHGWTRIDTDYKKQVFKLCNKLAEAKSWTELGLEFPGRRIVFELVYGDEWQKVLNRLLKCDRLEALSYVIARPSIC